MIFCYWIATFFPKWIICLYQNTNLTNEQLVLPAMFLNIDIILQRKNEDINELNYLQRTTKCSKSKWNK